MSLADLGGLKPFSIKLSTARWRPCPSPDRANLCRELLGQHPRTGLI